MGNPRQPSFAQYVIDSVASETPDAVIRNDYFVQFWINHLGDREIIPREFQSSEDINELQDP